MPLIFVPPLLKFAFGALSGAVVVHWLLKELRGLDEELERIKAASSIDAAARQELPTLRRDPRSGDWRLT